MKESEVKEAVKLARKIMVVNADRVSPERRQLAAALIALEDDDVCDDDDDDEPTFPVVGAFGERLAQTLPENPVFEDEEFPLPEPETYDQRADTIGVPRIKQDTFLEIERAPQDQGLGLAWPPWGARAVCIHHDGPVRLIGVDTQNFHLGMRTLLGKESTAWYACAWRWITRRNWRVAEIDGNTVTLERTR